MSKVQSSGFKLSQLSVCGFAAFRAERLYLSETANDIPEAVPPPEA
jgi:hypothetical protein